MQSSASRDSDLVARVVFLAQVFGVALDAATQVKVVALSSWACTS